MSNLDWYRDLGPITPTRFPRLHVWGQARGVWRVLATDDLGDTAVTGVPCRTKAEALAEVTASPDLADWRDLRPL